MASEEDNQHNDVVAIELPAPAGWSKKFTPKKGGTPQRNDIVFISPTGEEIKSKKQLDQYLKSHPGGPAASEFEWGTGDTPRRSARLSEKSKAEVAPTSPSPKKKQKRSSTKQPQEKNSADVVEEEATGEKDATAEETEGTLESATVDAKEVTDKDVIIPEKPGNENVEKKTYTEEPGIATSVEPDAKMEESKETSSVEPSAQAEEPMVESSQPEVKNEEAKEVTNGGGEEAPAGKVDSALTEGVENSKEKEEAEEKAVEKKEEVLLQEPTTGS